MKMFKIIWWCKWLLALSLIEIYGKINFRGHTHTNKSKNKLDLLWVMI
jgi:hypothetical protein